MRLLQILLIALVGLGAVVFLLNRPFAKRQ